MEYTFKSHEFEGPLDLLLHLIKKNDMDIFNINIADITKQYLNYIENLKQLNLNIDSEYLSVASELIQLKSRELLPHEDEEEEDLKKEFINRLSEYKKYKDACTEFRNLESERHELYDRVPSLLNEFHSDKVIIDEDISLNDLLEAFIKFQEKKESIKPLNTTITKKEYSVHKRATEIKHKLKKYKTVKFNDLFDIFNKPYVVVTFLAILNLAKDGEVDIKQDSNLDYIILSVKGEV